MIETILKNQPTWQKIQWEHRSSTIIEGVLQVCYNNANGKIHPTGNTQSLCHLQLASRRYQPDAAAGGTKAEVQKFITILQNICSNRKATAITFREVLGMDSGKKDNENSSTTSLLAIDEFVSFCWNDTHAFMQNYDVVAKLLTIVISRPVHDLAIQRMFFEMCECFLKNDRMEMEFGNGMLKIMISVIEAQEHDAGVMELYYEFIPIVVIHGAMDVNEMIYVTGRILGVKEFQNKLAVNG